MVCSELLVMVKKLVKRLARLNSKRVGDTPKEAAKAEEPVIMISAPVKNHFAPRRRTAFNLPVEKILFMRVDPNVWGRQRPDA